MRAKRTVNSKKRKTKELATTQKRRPAVFYTDEMALELCEWLAAGKSLVSYCECEGRPSQNAIYSWLLTNEEFREKYMLARELQADTMADMLVDIADRPSVDNGQVSRDRLRVDTRKWIASKLRPKKYGDRAEVNVNADHRHHHSVEPVSSTDEWLEKVLDLRADSETEEPV